MQESLIDVDVETVPEPAPEPRATSKSIGAGDIVLVDKKGRRFHALVTELEQTGTGRFELCRAPARLAHLLPHGDGPRGHRRVAEGAPGVTPH